MPVTNKKLINVFTRLKSLEAWDKLFDVYPEICIIKSSKGKEVYLGANQQGTDRRLLFAWMKEAIKQGIIEKVDWKLLKERGCLLGQEGWYIKVLNKDSLQNYLEIYISKQIKYERAKKLRYGYSTSISYDELLAYQNKNRDKLAKLSFNELFGD